jgi:DNA-directed RNA polymerase specialized sigma24 family protein
MAIVTDEEPPSEISLFKDMARANKNEQAARVAFDCFYRRHSEYLYRFCLQFKDRLGGESGVEDLVHDVFLRAFDKAHTYRSGGSIEQAHQSNRTKNWLCKIAIRLAYSKFEKDDKFQTVLEAEQYLASADQDILRPLFEFQTAATPREMDARSLRASVALSTLKRRDRMILVFSLDWYNRSQRRFEPPSYVIQELCRRYRVNATNYRQIRDRAFHKMSNMLQQSCTG